MNWKNEAIDRLHRYPAMVRATQTLPLELHRLEISLTDLRSNSMEQFRPSGNYRAGEDRVLNNYVARQELTRQLDDVMLWVKVTDFALSILSQEEKTILLRMYVFPVLGAVSDLCEDLGVEQSTVYRKRDAALYRFTLALYGDA